MTPLATPYEILQLSQDEPLELTPESIKVAYHRALLLHHPDKIRSPSLTSNSQAPATSDATYSIDEIINAYQILIAWVKDDRGHETRQSSFGGAKTNGGHPGVETYDLDELEFDEATGTWIQGCRCGNKPGYVVTERGLEHESDLGHGEIYTGCNGCSLFIKVLFSVGREHDGDQSTGDSGRSR